jgi:hypothetical protein
MKSIVFLNTDGVKKSAEAWRMRAEEMRTLADEAHEALVQAMMLRIAADYDRLAALAEERTQRALRPPGPTLRRSEEASSSIP